MDYGVSYNIVVNEKAAITGINNFATAVSKASPKIINDLEQIRVKVESIRAGISTLNATFGSLNKIDLTRSKRQVSELAREMAKIRSKTVTITTKTATSVAGSGGSSTTASGGGGGRTAAARSLVAPLGGGSVKGVIPTSFLAGLSVPLITMGVTALFGRFIRDMVKESSQFQDTMTSVRNILRSTDKESATFAKRFGEVSDHIQQIGVDTKFTSLEIAGAAKYLAMAGMDLSTIDASMRPIANLAALSDTPIDKIADVVTNIMAGYGIASGDIASASDIIASAATSTNTSVLEMAEGFKFAARPLQLAGISFHEGAAAIGILANAGVKGTLAGTAIRAMMIRLTAPTKKAQDALQRLGITITETVDGVVKMKSLSDIFGQLRRAGASVADMYTIFDKIAGGASTAVFQSLMQLDYLTTKSSMSGGLAQFLAEEKMKTVVGLWQQITSQIAYLNQSVFDSIEPSLKKYQQSFLDWLKSDDAKSTFLQVGQFIKEAIEAAKTFFKLIYDWFWWIKNFMIGKFIFNKMAWLINSVYSAAGAFTAFKTAATGASAASTAVSTGMAGVASSGGLLGSAIAGVVAIMGTLAYNVWRTNKDANNLFSSLQVDDIRFTTLEQLENNLKGIKIAADNATGSVDSMLKGLRDASPHAGKGMAGSALASYKIWEHDMKSMLPGATFVDPRDEAYREKLVSDIIPNKLAKEFIAAEYGEYIANIKNAKTAAEAQEWINKFRSALTTLKMTSQHRLPTVGVENGVAKWSSDPSQMQNLEYLKESTEFRNIAYDLGMNQAAAMVSIGSMWRSTNRASIFKAMAGIGAYSDPGGYGGLFTPGTTEISPAKVRELFEKMKSYGYSDQDIYSRFDILGIKKYLMAEVNPQGEINQNLRNPADTDDQFSDLGINGVGGGSGGIRGGGSKNIIVNINNLMNVESADFGSDPGSIRDKVAQVLMDAVKDFEIAIS